MAYYSKENVKKFINENNEMLEAKGHKPITPVEQSLTQLANEEEIVGFFWVDINETKEGTTKIKMGGNSFVRIDFDLYTDDRFALDLYQSQIESITVSQVIKNREIDQERAKKSIQENKEDVEDNIANKLNKKQ